METSAQSVRLNFETICQKAIGTLQRRGVCKWIDRDELISEAALALSAKNPATEALAVTIARAAMIDAIRKNTCRERGRIEVRGRHGQDTEDASAGESWDWTLHVTGQVDPQEIEQAERGNTLPPHIWKALKALPPRQYRALALAFWGGMTGAEIGAEMGISGTSARALIEKAKKNLRRGAVISSSHTVTELGGESSGISPSTEVTL